MLKATKAAAAAGVMGVLATGTVFAHQPYHAQPNTLQHQVMKPGRGISLDFGGKHAVGYFVTASKSCQLTVVVADALGSEPGKDSPGTRFVLPVTAGKTIKLDAGAGQSADFFCGLGASRMIARVYDRAPYKS